LLLLLLSAVFALRYGGRDGRGLTAMLVLASIATMTTDRLDRGWDVLRPWLFSIDTALLVGIVALALRSRRFWTIWAAGFQLPCVMAHVAMALMPMGAALYYAMESVWSLPMLLVMLFGVLEDHRAGVVDTPRRERLA
jgi:hypothetical protein